jgi:cell division protein FtsN
MAKFERGVYEPGDDVRVFDAAEDEEDVEGSRLPLLIVLALVVLAMFAGVVYLAYTQGVAKGRGEIPVLAAANGPARVAPQQPGGAQVPYQGFKIYEQPAPPDDAADAAPGQAATGEPASGQAATGQTASATQRTSEATPAPQTAAPPKPKPAAPAPETRAAAAKPAQPRVQPSPAPAKPVPAPMSASAPTGVATAAPRSLGGAPAAAGSYFLQIGAYKTQADAESAWKTFQARHGTLLAGHGLNVQRVDLGEKGIWYRARVGGFPDRDVALAMCGRLKADGGACFLAR